jgi:hypothetical protein
LAKIYRQLFKEYKGNEKFKNNAKFIIIDFNGEYIDNAIVSKERKNSYNLTTKEIRKDNIKDKFPITKSTIIEPHFLYFHHSKNWLTRIKILLVLPYQYLNHAAYLK